MNTTPQFSSRRRIEAFTLIELLVVIAVIALLAGLIFPVTGVVNKAKIRAKARVELEQIRTYIEAYKAKLGHYPPDNPMNPRINPLLFELAGTSLQNNEYVTLDKVGRIPAASVQGTFGVGGFANSMQGSGGDEGAVSRRFLLSLKPEQTAELTPGTDIRILVCTVPWPDNNPYQPAGLPRVNPFRYVSSNPTNNPRSYDLWVDVIVSGKTNRICNWSKEPLIVGDPR